MQSLTAQFKCLNEELNSFSKANMLERNNKAPELLKGIGGLMEEICKRIDDLTPYLDEDKNG